MGRIGPDLSGLRLDSLLRELADRAGELMATQSRTQGLLDAVVTVASDLSLPDVLRRIVTSSVTLVGAQYGALGVLAEGREYLSDFLHVGIDDVERERIGDLPTGKGVLGQLIRHPEPLRLHDIAEHPRSYGFPPGHPPMRTFLGVPIRVRGEVFGNLYLTDKHGGSDFTAEDQEIVVALAAAAGIAIENARLYVTTRQRELWLRASTEITHALLSGRGTREVLVLIAQQAREITGGTVGGIALADEDNTELALEVVDGELAHELEGRTIPFEGTLMSKVATADQAVPVANADPPQWLGADAVHDPLRLDLLGPMLLVPLRTGEHLTGVLIIAREQGHQSFGDVDRQMAMTFAAQAALALEFARAQEDRQRLAVYQDRDRIARDLHDLVIQRLFATALGLQGLSRQVSKPAVGERLSGYVNDLDQTIRDIRRSIFSLQDIPDDPGPDRLRAQLLRTVQDATEMLGFEPRLTFDGPLDSAVPDAIADDLLATLRESLSNVARHADATEVRVAVSVDQRGTAVELHVTDNGRGIDTEAPRGNGLSNVAGRAGTWGGTCTVLPAPGRGTSLRWTAPLHLSND
jgi:signal transduction histidine kinase